MIELRDYQRSAVDATYDAFRHRVHRPLVVIPTGGGKSLILCTLIKELLDQKPDRRIVMLVDSMELVDQNYWAMKKVWPEVPITVYAAGLKKKNISGKVLFGSIQSLHDKAEAIERCNIVIIDECFPAETMIDTAHGPMQIDQVWPGTVVRHAFGEGTVQSVSIKHAYVLFRVELDDGSSFRCTGNHPIFTDRGWVKAEDLEVGSRLYRKEDVQGLRRDLPALDQEERGRRGSELHEGAFVGQAGSLLQVLLEEISEPDVLGKLQREDGTYPSSDRPSAKGEGWEWMPSDRASAGTSGCSGQGMDSGTRYSNQAEEPLSPPLQGRLGQPLHDDSYRGGREVSRRQNETGEGSEEGRAADKPRVVSVSRLEFDRPEPVFNLQVSGHPSFFAAGVLVHNCHMIPPRGDGRYRKLLAKLEEINKHIGVVGFTATPFRLTSGSLVEGTGRVFDEIVYEVPVLDLVEKGWLCPLVTKGTKTVLEAGGVKVRAGEFVEHDLQNAVDTDDLVEAACDEIARYGEGRRCWLVFSTGVKHAYHISEALEGRGVRSAVIHAKTPNLERKQIVADHKAGRLKCIVNDSVLTKGFDNPLIDLIAVLRPTQSAGLWVQMCGRGMRTLEGKDDCLVLDFGRNTARHGPLDRIKGPAMKDKTIAANLEDDGDLAKECPQCASILPLEERVCPDCGYTWPREERVRKMHEAVADEAPLFSSDISGWLPVSRVTYHEHYKAGSSPTMRVEYHCGLMIYKEWVAFEHQGLPRTKAERWWRERTGSVMATPCPLFSRDAVRWGEEGSLKEPIAIRVRPDGKYWKVVSVRFSEPYVPVPAMQARMAA